MTTSPALRFLEANAWGLLPTVYDALVDIVERHAEGVRLGAAEISAAIGRDPEAPAEREPRMQIVGATAVITMRGVIAQYADQVNDVSQPRGRSAESVQRDLRAAAGDASVRAIVLRIDSPGGSVAGTAETADLVRSISAGGKPVIAYVDGMAASAAYWVASQADEIVASSAAALVGSIGIVSAVVTRKDDQRTVTVLRSVPLKAPGTAGEDLNAEQRASVQRNLDELHQAFAQAVAAGRGLGEDDQVAAANGEVFAAGRALALGLIDRVDSWDAVMAHAASGVAAYTPARARVVATPYTASAQAQSAENPEQPTMKLTAAVVLALCASFGDHIALIQERANAGDDESQVRAAIAKAEDAKAKAKAVADLKAKDDRIAALETQTKADAAALAQGKVDLAALQAKHDALAALRDGAAAGTTVKPDPKDGGKAMSRAEFDKLSPKAQGQFLATDGTVIEPTA